MARINIEDSIYQDERFIDLIVRMGGRFTAVGALVSAWSLAQKWYLKPGGKIPMKVWQEQRIPNELIDVGLAEVVDGRVRMKGIDEQFAWLKQRSESGKKGGPAAAKAHHENIEESRRRGSSEDDGKRPLTLPLPLSLSLTQAHSQKKEEDKYVSSEPCENAPEETLSSRPSKARPRGPITELSDEVASKYLAEVGHDTQKAWLAVYPEPGWVLTEIRKAHVWITANPQKRPKNFGRFMSSWLSRSFEQYRKGLPSRRLTNSELNMQSIGDMYRKIEEEK